MTRIFAFLKFGAPEHLQALRERGELYCNTLEYFRLLEHGERGDSNDGDASAYQGDMLEVVFKHGDEEIVLDSRAGLVGQVTLSVDAHLSQNAFCMYALTSESVYVDPRNFEFGPSCLLIHDVRAFLARVRLMTPRPAQCAARLVEYYDPELVHGHLGPFKKHRRFAHQSEYRILLSPNGGGPHVVNVGSLADISTIVSSHEINSIIRVNNRLLQP